VEFHEMREMLFEYTAPEDAMECWLVERLVTLQWRMHRAGMLEAAIMTYRVRALSGGGFNPYLKPVAKFELPGPDDVSARSSDASQIEGPPLHASIPDLGEAYMVDMQEGGALSKIRRDETSLENSFFKTWRELERRQERRRQRQSMSPPAAYTEVSGPAENRGPERKAA
jgi:hypothetical protein